MTSRRKIKRCVYPGRRRKKGGQTDEGRERIGRPGRTVQHTEYGVHRKNISQSDQSGQVKSSDLID